MRIRIADEASVLLLDVGGVLFTFDHLRRLAALADVLGLSPDLVDTLLWRSGFSADCDAGRYPDASTVRAQVRRITGYTGTDADLDEAWCSAFRPDDRVLDLFDATPVADGLRLGVFTNNGPLEEEILLRRYPEAFESLPARFFCYRLVANKPDPAVFRQVAASLAVPSTAIWFVDDSADNVSAALECGWHAIHYRDPADVAYLLRR